MLQYAVPLEGILCPKRQVGCVRVESASLQRVDSQASTISATNVLCACLKRDSAALSNVDADRVFVCSSVMMSVTSAAVCFAPAVSSWC